MFRKRVPKFAAMTIDNPPGKRITLTSVMRKVAAEVNFKTLEVVVKNTRRKNAKGILLKLNTEEDADRLTDQIKRTLDPSIQVGRPSLVRSFSGYSRMDRRRRTGSGAHKGRRGH